MQKYIYYGIGLGVAFITGYILAAYHAKKIQDDTHDAAINTVLRSSDTIADLKNKLQSLEKDNERLRKEHKFLCEIRDDISDPYEEEIEEKSEIIQRIANKDINPNPYVISFNQFEDPDYHFFDKLSLSYYPDDDTLCNDEYEAIDQDETVGSQNLNIFRRESDVTCIYIRNELLLSDYEITLEEGSYREEVLGLREDE